MQFRILGTLEVFDDQSRIVEIGGRKPRALLVLLLLNANRTVSVSRLVDELWGEQPPANAAKAVQVYVSRLRKALQSPPSVASSERIRTGSRGYTLTVEPGELDLERFRILAEEGSRALAAGDPGEASEHLARALELWRGPPLEEFAEEPFAPELGRLDELRLGAVEQRIEADLALDRHAALTPELTDLVHQHPFRERLLAQLMLALARSGRQADALAAYQEGRTKLIYELGIEPGPPLRELERAILEQRESVSPRPAEAPASSPQTSVADATTLEKPRERPRRRRLVPATLAVALVVAGAVTALVISITGRDRAGPASAPPNALAVVEPVSVRMRVAVAVGEDPAFVAVGEGAVWVASVEDRTLSRVEPDRGR